MPDFLTNFFNQYLTSDSDTTTNFKIDLLSKIFKSTKKFKNYLSSSVSNKLEFSIR